MKGRRGGKWVIGLIGIQLFLGGTARAAEVHLDGETYEGRVQNIAVAREGESSTVKNTIVVAEDNGRKEGEFLFGAFGGKIKIDNLTATSHHFPYPGNSNYGDVSNGMIRADIGGEIEIDNSHLIVTNGDRVLAVRSLNNDPTSAASMKLRNTIIDYRYDFPDNNSQPAIRALNTYSRIELDQVTLNMISG